MANVKISALPAVTSLAGTEQFPVVQSGATKVATVNQLVAALSGGLLQDLPEWQPNTAYTAGEVVLNPSGAIVQATTEFTSGTTYNAANWTALSLTVAGVQALIAAQAASDSATYTTLAQALLTWTLAQAFTVTSATRDANEAITTASIVWPDGATGTFTTDTASTAFPGAIDAYHVTHVLSGVTKTVTQPAVTRDAGGAVVNQPALTVA